MGTADEREERPMEQRTDHADEDEVQETPVPPDAPIETPQADPRTEGAPDGGDAEPVADSDDATESQIREAFE
jgi:hypothetical protein